MLKQIRPAIVMIVVMTVITGLVYPLGMTGIAQLVFPHQANGSLIEKDGKVDRLRADRPELHRRQIFPRPAVGDDRARSEGSDQDHPGALCRRQFGRLEPRPDLQGADRPREGRCRQAEGGEPAAPVPVDLVTTSASGLDPDITPGRRLLPGAAGRQGARPARGPGAPAGRRHTSRAASSASSASRMSMC